MASIGTHFSPAQLRTIRNAVSGEPQEIFQSTPEKPKNGNQDVLILGPSDDIFQSDFDLSDNLESKGVKVQEDLDKFGVTAQLSQEEIAKLKEDGYRVYDNSPRQLWPGIPRATSAQVEGSDFSMPKVEPVGWLQADDVHAAGRTGAGQTVAVLDSGFDHPQFQLKAWKDVVADSPVPTDMVGHGTHVAYDVLQTAPEADIVAVKVMGDDGSGRPSDIIRGIRWAVEQKTSGNIDIDVINMSLGGPPDGFPDILDPINRAVSVAHANGITVVAAAGNSGPDGHTVGSPAESPVAIAVGAALNPTTVSDFSSRGPTDDGLVKPDVVAPGEYISGWSVAGSEMEQTARAVETLRAMSGEQLKELLANRPELIFGLGLPEDILDKSPEEVAKLVKPGLPPTYIPEEGLVAAPGTSFAAPLVAGVLATLEQERDISPEESMDLLRGTADNMGDFVGNEQGAGFVDAKEALEKLRSA